VGAFCGMKCALVRGVRKGEIAKGLTTCFFPGGREGWEGRKDCAPGRGSRGFSVVRGWGKKSKPVLWVYESGVGHVLVEANPGIWRSDLFEKEWEKALELAQRAREGRKGGRGGQWKGEWKGILIEWVGGVKGGEEAES